MNEWCSLRKWSIAALAALTLSTVTHSVQANLVTNGSFSMTTGVVPEEIATTVLTGWTINGNFLGCVVFDTATTNACGMTGPSAGAKLWADPGPSPDGGNFVLIDGDPDFALTLSQTVDGLINDQLYEVSFWQGAGQFQSFSGDTKERWKVTLGSDSQLSEEMSTDSHSFHPWMQQSLNFKASCQTASPCSAVLSFFAVGSPMGLPPVVFLDGVSLNSVPEPETLALVGIGLFGALVTRKKFRMQA